MFYGDIIQTENPIKILSNVKIYTLDSFRFIGVGILAFEGILTVLPIRDSMINRFVFYLPYHLGIQKSLLKNYVDCLYNHNSSVIADGYFIRR